MHGNGMTRRTALAAGVAGGTLLMMPGSAWAKWTLTSPVDTTAGKVRGKREGGVSTFLGIPYGASTAGALRFLPPADPKPWTGARTCATLGHQAPQMEIGGAGMSGPGANLSAPFVLEMLAATKQGMEVGNEGEDCLVLNVYTPDASPAKKRPVMVWLHGGGFAIGSAGDPQYDGAPLARRGDVVVVGVNHRLNALGYLYLGDLHPDFADSGNAGSHDIVHALKWVRDNIANFGGDPGNVTIFGESGGGAKVSVTLAMPSARGLFHKAIIQSGPGLTGVERAAAAAHAERTLEKLGIARGDVHKIQSLPYKDVIAAAKAAQGPGGRVLAPLVDGRGLPRHPFTPDAPDTAAGIPLMIGTCKDEATLFMAADPNFGKYTEEQALQRARSMGAQAEAAYQAYRTLHPNDAPTYWLTSMMTGRGTWMDSIRLAERKAAQGGAPLYMFRLDWETPMLGGKLKTPHGLEVPLAFDTVSSRPLILGSGPEPKKIAAEMAQAWANFARTGNPSQPGLEWPQYDTTTRRTMIFDTTSKVVGDPDAAARVVMSA